MTKSFQKTASNLIEMQLPHPGIIYSAGFNEQFELHCYEPPADLRPFVAHIWTQRHKPAHVRPQVPMREIPSGSNVYLFFTPTSAFIHPVGASSFDYDPFACDVLAGVKFKPGGFYAFSRRPVSQYTDPVPAATIFTRANATFSKQLLIQPDAAIVSDIEALLRDTHPQNDKNISLIAEITHLLTTDNSLQTVDAICQAFHMRERSLQLLFQTYVGVGPKWIITRRRLLRALSYAQSRPRLTWTNIAAELGYSSLSHLSRDLKKITGINPSQYTKYLKRTIDS
ncbi:helix-turn-helix transcriptional regulator [Streptomyces caniscabiei]|uniref:helix-turn-helix domain-containing protein n=1 Tax=Streptomyces caniscabiei TaxID=2746961 RepID=UPI0029AF6886|nr:helix-turn-helix transcriptional regulator [Streptomyces caniscabiei]MDX2776666.1 helix-turn-helix transcriptional regulator [Streptomyces caniscabiei]